MISFTRKIFILLLLSVGSVFTGFSRSVGVDAINRIVDASDRIIKAKGNISNLDSLLASLPVVSINDSALDSVLTDKNTRKVINAIYMIADLKNGSELNEARDAISFTTLFPFRKLNENDFRKLRDVFNTDKPMLHKAYLSQIEFAFRNNGPLPGLLSLRPLIEEKISPCEEKGKALAVIDRYIPIADGKPAPVVTFVDDKGKPFSIADYRGKTIVIDVWATWCHNCLKKMPELVKLRREYSKNKNIVFLTVSIDRNDDLKKWKEFSKKYSIAGKDNLIAVGSANKSEFESLYCIEGIPRCIVIDSEGNLVSAYAPGAGEELETLIKSII